MYAWIYLSVYLFLYLSTCLFTYCCIRFNCDQHRNLFFAVLSDFLHVHIFRSGEEWRSLRMRVQPPFLRPKVTNQYVPAQDHVATDFVTSLRTSGNLTPEEQKDLIFRYVLECKLFIPFLHITGKLSVKIGILLFVLDSCERHSKLTDRKRDRQSNRWKDGQIYREIGR